MVGSDENMRELAREGTSRDLPRETRGETEGYRLRGVVVPMGRKPEDDVPMVALLGGRVAATISSHDVIHPIFDRDDDEFELAFGGSPVGWVFSGFDRLHEDTGDGVGDVGDGGDGDDGDGGDGGD
ncbi:hypothetical protein [Methanopyrus kandleri]|uniref:hypothetical protein n=1 Tax=Methanopyrus kandleri TaxID=2320 RepID=UPI0011E4E2D0|nr:hypothetical protein [Methanopyrus kandleri]